MKIKDDKKIDIIFNATLDLIEQRGISGVSIDLIAKKSKLATGTIYIYFQNKDDLINRLYLHTKKSFYQSLYQGYDEKEPFKKSFKKIWLNLLSIMQLNYKENIFHDQYYHSQYSNEESKNISNQMMLPLINILERGKNEAIIKDTDNLLICAYIYGCIKEVVKLASFSNNDLSNQMIEDYFTLCWDGLKS